MNKIYLSAAIAALFCLQFPNMVAQETCNALFTQGDGMTQPYAISNNGRYVVGQEGQFSGFIWDTEMDKYETILRNNGSEGNENKSVIAWDVLDDGTVIGSHEDKPGTRKNGEWSFLPLPKGFRGGEAMGASNNGEIICGWVSDGKGKACIWKNGEIQILEGMDDDKGKTPQFVHAERISGDGSVVTGFLRTNQGFYVVGLVWRAPEYKCEALFMDSLLTKGGAWRSYTISAVSENSKWLAGLIARYEDNDDSRAIAQPYRYNLETGELEYINDIEIDYGIGDGGPAAIDNLGTVYSASAMAGNPYARHAYISQIGKPSMDIGDYLSEVYGYDEVMKTLPYTGIIMSVTPESENWAGFGAGLDDGQEFIYWGYKIEIRPDKISTIGEEGKTLSCYVNNRELFFKGHPTQVEVLNVGGAVVQSAAVGGIASVSLAGLPQGIYMVKLSDGKVSQVQKIAIK